MITPLRSSRLAPLLAGLDSLAVDTIFARARTRTVSAHGSIQTAGQKATHLFLLQAGRARYYRTDSKGGEILLQLLAPGDVMGMVALLAPQVSYVLNVDAISACELIAWERNSIRDLARFYPKIAENALKISLEYLGTFIARHARLLNGTAQERLGATLLSLARRTGAVSPAGVQVDATNDQLSGLSDISRFTASRLLGHWERKGVVSKARGRIVIHSPESLAEA
jgi:CRP/FNR family transcriptional regulator, nitrogen oxide reductase regulator